METHPKVGSVFFPQETDSHHETPTLGIQKNAGSTAGTKSPGARGRSCAAPADGMGPDWLSIHVLLLNHRMVTSMALSAGVRVSWGVGGLSKSDEGHITYTSAEPTIRARFPSESMPVTLPQCLFPLEEGDGMSQSARKSWFRPAVLAHLLVAPPFTPQRVLVCTMNHSITSHSGVAHLRPGPLQEPSQLRPSVQTFLLPLPRPLPHSFRAKTEHV